MIHQLTEQLTRIQLIRGHNNEENKTLKVELTNFVDKTEAMDTAKYIIAALGIAEVHPLEISETLH